MGKKEKFTMNVQVSDVTVEVKVEAETKKEALSALEVACGHFKAEFKTEEAAKASDDSKTEPADAEPPAKE